MTRVVLSRLLQLPVILLVIYTITLVLAWAAPGNPLTGSEGRRPPAEVRAAMLAQYNLDSFPRFYVSYLASASGVEYARDRLAGREPGPVFDLGPSLQYKDHRVNEIIASSLPVSMTLGAMALLLALAMGLVAGVIGAARPGSAWDACVTGLTLIGVSVPSFVVGAGVLMLFSAWLGWFPVASWGSPRDMVLPAVTLSLPFAAYIARLTRLGMIEALQSDYVRTARAIGVPERTILFRHALKNAFLPVLSFLGPASASAMTGSFVVERVFTVPGLGQHFVNAVQNKDLFLIIGVVLVYSTMLVIFNLVVDVLYRWIDPRIA